MPYSITSQSAFSQQCWFYRFVECGRPGQCFKAEVDCASSAALAQNSLYFYLACSLYFYLTCYFRCFRFTERRLSANEQNICDAVGDQNFGLKGEGRSKSAILFLWADTYCRNICRWVKETGDLRGVGSWETQQRLLWSWNRTCSPSVVGQRRWFIIPGGVLLTKRQITIHLQERWGTSKEWLVTTRRPPAALKIDNRGLFSGSASCWA